MLRFFVGLAVVVFVACASSKSSPPPDDALASSTGGVLPSTGGQAGSSPRGGSASTSAGGAGGSGAQGGTAGTAAPADAAATAVDTGPPLARAFTARTSPVSGDLEYLASSSEVIVAAGKKQLIYSDDGLTWSTPDPAVAANAVAYGGGVFVATGEPGIVFTSVDGKRWTQIAPFSSSFELSAVTYAFGKFFLVSFDEGSGAYFTSDDGTTWKRATAKFSDPSFKPFDWNDLVRAFSAGQYLFFSSTWGIAGHNFRSKDGITWDVIKDWTSLTYDAAYDGTLYCSVGAYSGGASTDAMKWTTSGAGLHSIVYWDGVFYAIGGFGDMRASRDCQHWQAGAAPDMPEYLPNGIEAGLEAIRVFRDRLVIVGMGGRIYTSP